jgi:CubicO group peptidase (beta-lactamase class C family)
VEPGTRFGYHALTSGFLLGETMRRVTGRTVTALLRELLTGPLGVEDEIFFAVPRRLLPAFRLSRAASRSVTAPGVRW